MQVLGIDIGGSGIKGAPVDTDSGDILAARVRLLTPIPSKPKAVAEAVKVIAHEFDWKGPVGIGFPSVVRDGIVYTAANIHPKWVDTDAGSLFARASGCPVYVINDADAAGLAEMEFGAGRGQKGVVLLVTIGTGLGTVLFTEGRLLPNAELGHIEIDGEDAEYWASDAARKREKMSWKKWSGYLDRYLCTMERLFWPDLIILGGGVVKAHQKFMPRLTLRTQVVPAQLLNEAGIIGAALAGRDHLNLP